VETEERLKVSRKALAEAHTLRIQVFFHQLSSVLSMCPVNWTLDRNLQFKLSTLLFVGESKGGGIEGT